MARDVLSFIHRSGYFVGRFDGLMDRQTIADDRTYSVEEIRCKRFNAYYRVMADGVEFPSTVYIVPSQKTIWSRRQLKAWCKRNSHRLSEGEMIQADLSGAARGRSPLSLFWRKLCACSLDPRK